MPSCPRNRLALMKCVLRGSFALLSRTSGRGRWGVAERFFGRPCCLPATTLPHPEVRASASLEGCTSALPVGLWDAAVGCSTPSLPSGRGRPKVGRGARCFGKRSPPLPPRCARRPLPAGERWSAVRSSVDQRLRWSSQDGEGGGPGVTAPRDPNKKAPRTGAFPKPQAARLNPKPGPRGRARSRDTDAPAERSRARGPGS